MNKDFYVLSDKQGNMRRCPSIPQHLRDWEFADTLSDRLFMIECNVRDTLIFVDIKNNKFELKCSKIPISDSYEFRLTKRIKDGSKWVDAPMTRYSLKDIHIKGFGDERRLLSNGGK